MKVLTKKWVAQVFAKSAQEEEAPLLSSPPTKKTFSLSREQLATWVEKSAQEEEMPLVSPSPSYRRFAHSFPHWLGPELWGELVALSESRKKQGHTVSPEELALKFLQSAVKRAANDGSFWSELFSDTNP